MPPVRDASTNPRAATVLPAPVACSNQKRRSAPGSSSGGGGSSSSSASTSASASQSSGSSSSPSSSSPSPGRVSLVEVTLQSHLSRGKLGEVLLREDAVAT